MKPFQYQQTAEPPIFSFITGLGSSASFGGHPLYAGRTIVYTSLVSVLFFAAPVAVPALSWAPSYPSRVDRPFQHAASTPFLAQGQVLPPPPPPLNWQPRYPDQIPPGRRLETANQKAWFGIENLAPIPRTSWLPIYPDRIPPPRSLEACQQRAYFGPDRQPLPRPGWEPTYPSRIPVSVLPTAGQRTYFAPDRQPFPPGWGWGAFYPNPTGGWPQLPVGSQRAFFSPERQQPLPPSSEAIYPDWIPGAIFSAASQQALAWSTFTPAPAVVPLLSWKGSYPDFLLSALRATQPDALSWSTLTPVTIPHSPSFSGFIVFPGRTVLYQRGAGPVFFTPPPPAPELSWSPVYPDLIFPKPSLVTAQQLAYFGPLIPIVPPPSFAWLSTSYPSKTFKSVDIELGRSVIVTPPDLFNWLPIYPDPLPAQRPPVQGGVVAPIFPPAAAAVPALSWSPTYPNWIQPRPFLCDQRAWFGIERLAPIPSITSWLGGYPDRIDRPAFPTIEQRAYFGPERQPLPTPGWGAIYPVIVPLALRPVFYASFFWSGFTPGAVPFFQTVYPDRIDRSTFLAANQRAVVFLFTPTPPAVPILSWGASYPNAIDRVFPIAVYAAGRGPGSDFPIPPPSATQSKMVVISSTFGVVISFP